MKIKYYLWKMFDNAERCSYILYSADRIEFFLNFSTETSNEFNKQFVTFCLLFVLSLSSSGLTGALMIASFNMFYKHTRGTWNLKLLLSSKNTDISGSFLERFLLSTLFSQETRLEFQVCVGMKFNVIILACLLLQAKYFKWSNNFVVTYFFSLKSSVFEFPWCLMLNSILKRDFMWRVQTRGDWVHFYAAEVFVSLVIHFTMLIMEHKA